MSLRQTLTHWFQPETRLDPMIELQYQTMVGMANRNIPAEELQRPELVTARVDFRKIEAIEASLGSETGEDMAERILRPFLSSDNPWLSARAAKALYPINPNISLHTLQHLLKRSSAQHQLPAVWALGELSTVRSIQLLMSVAWSPHPEIQHTVLRYLVQLENKKQVPSSIAESFQRLLKDVRSKSDWIL